MKQSWINAFFFVSIVAIGINDGLHNRHMRESWETIKDNNKKFQDMDSVIIDTLEILAELQKLDTK